MTDRDFYRLQNQWSHIYYRGINDSDSEKVAWVESVTGQGKKSILELGAGGGQFSVAAARAGHFVTALEIEPGFVSHIRELAQMNHLENLQIKEGDFYEVEFEQTFDLICYWDGFGTGSDELQKQLLVNIKSWLSESGSALIDIYTPWYWATKACGVTQKIGNVVREYGFDFEASCLLDTWWHSDNPNRKTTQCLRCYSPADMNLLLAGLDLEINAIYPGGSVDYETGTYEPVAPLARAMSYTVQLIKKKAGSIT